MCLCVSICLCVSQCVCDYALHWRWSVQCLTLGNIKTAPFRMTMTPFLVPTGLATLMLEARSQPTDEETEAWSPSLGPSIHLPRRDPRGSIVFPGGWRADSPGPVGGLLEVPPLPSPRAWVCPNRGTGRSADLSSGWCQGPLEGGPQPARPRLPDYGLCSLGTRPPTSLLHLPLKPPKTHLNAPTPGQGPLQRDSPVLWL